MWKYLTDSDGSVGGTSKVFPLTQAVFVSMNL
jgi:hypothetical protein